MIDKTNDKADEKRNDKTPDKPVDEGKRRADIAAEYETLLSQSQDEHSIIKALCTKHSLDQVALGDLMAEARKDPKGLAKAEANPAIGGQMGMAPPKGTVQSGKEPKTD